jgi:hypothetical protein
VEDRNRHQRSPPEAGNQAQKLRSRNQASTQGTAKYESSHPLPRALRALAHKAADHPDGPHPLADLGAVAARCEHPPSPRRAIHVP